MQGHNFSQLVSLATAAALLIALALLYQQNIPASQPRTRQQVETFANIEEELLDQQEALRSQVKTLKKIEEALKKQEETLFKAFEDEETVLNINSQNNLKQEAKKEVDDTVNTSTIRIKVLLISRGRLSKLQPKFVKWLVNCVAGLAPLCWGSFSPSIPPPPTTSSPWPT